ncbi:MJ1255/VC2487 family glycosyltransferase [Echinimonas agarilytica]|uniref:Glycosyltransferase n=1 Tax=Echinimonas agarilytica TaxID=1215918 RepID=A0AA41W3T3_9GAMM|nr:MJ1255/VC2487 family glycosyltransferase [Echinimonas agarilytica]MCM2678306.1 glycosyltransferase [Echinimonas agarilytica]
MRILYGVQATGNGHITRARAMATAFQNTDIKVDYLFSGRAPEELFNMDLFGDYEVRGGLSFATSQGRVNLFKTMQDLNARQLVKDIKQLDVSGYDLILNDFEPVSAWAAKLQKVRCIGLSHQAAFSFPIPKTGQDLGSKIVMKYFAPTSEKVGVHWHHFGHAILPPIINVDMQRCAPVKGKVIVYLPFESLADIAQLLKSYSQVDFYIYHPETKDADVDHLHYRALNRESFEANLQNCEGVIANGGFELPSESLFLGKKILVKPLVRQFEQESNVLTLEQLNLASTMQKLDADVVSSWLEKPAAEPVNYPNVAQMLAQWIAAGATRPMSEVADELWSQVQFPPYATVTC